jgi:hypothetical protein
MAAGLDLIGGNFEHVHDVAHRGPHPRVRIDAAEGHEEDPFQTARLWPRAHPLVRNFVETPAANHASQPIHYVHLITEFRTL